MGYITVETSVGDVVHIFVNHIVAVYGSGYTTNLKTSDGHVYIVDMDCDHVMEIILNTKGYKMINAVSKGRSLTMSNLEDE